MLVDIPDALLVELKKQNAKVQSLQDKSGTDAYWGAVGDQEIAMIEIIAVVNAAISEKK